MTSDRADVWKLSQNILSAMGNCEKYGGKKRNKVEEWDSGMDMVLYHSFKQKGKNAKYTENLGLKSKKGGVK